MFGKKMRGKIKVLSVFLTLALAFSMAGIFGQAPVLAATTSQFNLVIDGGTPITITASNINSHANYKLVHYSGRNNAGVQAYYSTRGVDLEDLIAPYVPLGESLTAATTEIIITADDATTKTFYGDDIFGTARYYYPSNPLDPSVQVYPLIATSDAASITTNPAAFGSGDALRFYYGQTTDTEKNRPNWVKWVETIEVNF